MASLSGLLVITKVIWAMTERKHSFYEMCSLRFSGQPEKFFLGRFFGDRSCFLERVIENVVDGQNKTAFRNWSWKQKAVGGNARFGRTERLMHRLRIELEVWEVVGWQNCNNRLQLQTRGSKSRPGSRSASQNRTYLNYWTPCNNCESNILR